MFHRDGPTLFELAEQALASTDRGYDLLAPKFDLTPFRTPDKIVEVSAAFYGKGARGIDLCCGTGAGLRSLLPHCDEVVGIDRSRGMLVEAARRLPPEEASRVRFVRGDALSLPFHEEFDVATCYGAFGHVLERDEPRFVDQVYRALRPGGRFVFVTSAMPSVLSPTWWMARGFNGVMRVRNAVLKPEFIMYYLTFLVDGATRHLEQRGFKVEAHRNVMPAPFARAIVVVATRP